MISLRIACRGAIAAAIVLPSPPAAHAELLVGDFRGADTPASVFRYTRVNDKVFSDTTPNNFAVR